MAARDLERATPADVFSRADRRLAVLEHRARHLSRTTFQSDDTGDTFSAIEVFGSILDTPPANSYQTLTTFTVDRGAWVAHAYVSASYTAQDTNPPAGSYPDVRIGLVIDLTDGTTTRQRLVHIPFARQTGQIVCLSGLAAIKAGGEITVTVRIFGTTYAGALPFANATVTYYQWATWMIPT